MNRNLLLGGGLLAIAVIGTWFLNYRKESAQPASQAEQQAEQTTETETSANINNQTAIDAWKEFRQTVASLNPGDKVGDFFVETISPTSDYYPISGDHFRAQLRGSIVVSAQVESWGIDGDYHLKISPSSKYFWLSSVWDHSNNPVTSTKLKEAADARSTIQVQITDPGVTSKAVWADLTVL